MARLKIWFDKRPEALRAAKDRGQKFFKQKHGRNKGRFFVGTEFQFLNVNY